MKFLVLDFLLTKEFEVAEIRLLGEGKDGWKYFGHESEF